MDNGDDGRILDRAHAHVEQAQRFELEDVTHLHRGMMGKIARGLEDRVLLVW